MKNKGFTLIELIAVIVIMGMLLLIVFPATARLMRSNENKKYDTYYDAVQEQLELYARTRRDELGGIQGSGCVDDKELDKLKNYDYIKEYTEEKDVTCHSPSEFQLEELIALEIDTSKQYDNIRIENNKGNVKVQYSMICVRNREDPNRMSLVYSHLIENTSSCENYVPEITNSLLNSIKNKYTVTPVGNDSYITGVVDNNYVWYSGKMWRIISYNESERTIKLVTDDIVSVLNYNNIENNDYSSSNIFIWLKNVFLPTLKNPDKYLESVYWNYSPVGSDVSEPITSGASVESKIGMINNFEYNKGSQFLNKGKNFWLLSTYSNGTDYDSAWYVDTAGSVTSDEVTNFYGVRASVVLKPNIKYVYGGNGTYENPFKLVGDNSANVGTTLNKRIPGEYVSFNGALFRISSVDASYTKLIAMETLTLDEEEVLKIPHIKENIDYNISDNTIAFHYFDRTYSDNTFVGEYLKGWVEESKSLLVPMSLEDDPDYEEEYGVDFCRMTITKNTSQTVICPKDDVIKTNVSIPRVGEMFVIGSTDVYWTMNNNTEDTINVINSDCSISTREINDIEGNTKGKATILPVVAIRNDVKIAGGNGTYNSPYTLQE